MRCQTEIILYRNSQHALDGSISGAVWAYPGTALSANTVQLYAQMGLTLVYARWMLAWNPNTGPSPTGVRLVNADSGPSNEGEMARFLIANANTPRVDAVDVTTPLKYWLAAGNQKTLAHQTCGNGTNGCKIFASVIECVWG